MSYDDLAHYLSDDVESLDPLVEQLRLLAGLVLRREIDRGEDLGLVNRELDDVLRGKKFGA